MTLDRWCARVAAAYPEGPRRAEVATTLVDAGAGRRVPRVGDALDVLRHGLVARVASPAPGTRYGAWGDVVSVAVALGLLVHAVTAAAVVWHAFAVPRDAPAPEALAWTGAYTRISFQDWREAVAATVAAVVAVAAVGALARGRVRAARALTVLAALGGLAIYVTERALEEHLTYTSWAGRAAVVAGLVVALAAVFTSALARAVRVVPRWWWAPATVACAGAAATAVAFGPHPLGRGRAAVLLTAFVYEAGVLLLVAAPLAGRAPRVLGGAVLAGVPVLPVAAYGVEQWLTVVPRTAALLVVTAAAFGFVLARVARGAPG